MTREEFRQQVDTKAMEQFATKSTELICDAYEKGFENGFTLGYKLAINNAAEWLKVNAELIRQDIAYKVWLIDMFKRDMKL